MAHYQLRVQRGAGINQIIRKMSEDGWKALRPFFAADRDLGATQRIFYEKIFETMHEYIRAYDLCGKSTMCSDEVEGAPWLDYDDEIYILDIPDTLEILIHNVAFSGMESAYEVLKPNNRRKVFSVLQRIFFKRLNTYLYHNPVCRNSEFCKLSSPITPWRQ